MVIQIIQGYMEKGGMSNQMGSINLRLYTWWIAWISKANILNIK